MLMGLYEHIDKPYHGDDKIRGIIYEQFPPYRAGDKSLDETIRNIQGRVELYVNEQR